MDKNRARAMASAAGPISATARRVAAPSSNSSPRVRPASTSHRTSSARSTLHPLRSTASTASCASSRSLRGEVVLIRSNGNVMRWARRSSQPRSSTSTRPALSHASRGNAVSTNASSSRVSSASASSRARCRRTTRSSEPISAPDRSATTTPDRSTNRPSSSAPSTSSPAADGLPSTRPTMAQLERRSRRAT